MKGVFFSNFADINYIGLVYIDDRKWNIVKKKKKNHSIPSSISNA